MTTKAKALVGIHLRVDMVEEYSYDGFGRISLEVKFSTPQIPNGFSFQIPPSASNSFAYHYDNSGNILPDE